jgi:hypothetical protein
MLVITRVFTGRSAMKTMRTKIVSALALAVAISGATFAQDKTVPATQDHTSAFAPKPLTVSGRVSADGRTFLTDIDSEWLVSNADVLKGHEGRLVRVKCYVDTEKNSIKILTVKKDEGESNYATRNTFSAVGR